MKSREKKANITCIDLFCGVGGLSYGLKKAGLTVVSGFDIDRKCKYAYEKNLRARFIQKDVTDVSASDLFDLWDNTGVTVLAGCAPCQPFSTYSQRYDTASSPRRGLLREFGRLVRQSKPDIVAMENVPLLLEQDEFKSFVALLKRNGYQVSYEVVSCVEFGLAQTRSRLVLLASQHHPIQLLRPKRKREKTLRDVIGKLPNLGAGEMDPADFLHVSSALTEINLRRIKASRPGGTWRDWPISLRAKCHTTESGRTYSAVYGRMEWDKPAPTLTTQFYGYGNGRFGHPEQHRAITLREGALIQGFPLNYKFAQSSNEIEFSALGRLIGNAVPVDLAYHIGKSIKTHVEAHR
jgi:DNA (cytosine-5)-methyltransferase 1